MKIKTKIVYILHQVLYWSIYCCLIGYASVYLMEANFSDASIGIFLALANFISVASQFLISKFIADRVSLVSLLKVSYIIMFGLGVALITNLLPQGLMIVLYGLVIIMHMTLLPYVNSLGLYYERVDQNLDFSFSRGFGSMSFAITSFMLGKVLTHSSARLLPVIASLLLVGLILIMYLSPHDRIETHHQQALVSESIYKKYPMLLLFMLSIILVFTYHNFINAFLPQIVTYVGGDNSVVGTALMIAGLMELPAMFFYSILSRKTSHAFWVVVSFVSYLLRSLAFIILGNVMGVYGAQAMQALSFALLLPSVSYFLKDLLTDSEQVQGQTAFTISMTIGGIFGNLVGGFILDKTGVAGMLQSGVLICSIALITFIIFLKGVNKKKHG